MGKGKKKSEKDNIKAMKLFGKRVKYPQKILIDNPGFTNRGDQLMIQAILEQIRLYRPQAQILVRRSAFEQNPSYCIQNKIYPLEVSNRGIKRSKLYTQLVNFLLRDEWINTPREVDLILDCAGYHLADWRIDNDDYVYLLSEFYKQFTKKGRRIILLPQALGPFTNQYSISATKMVHEYAEAIYAREIVSYDNIKALFPDSSKIKIAPDFTCLVSGTDRNSIVLPRNQYVLMIPNYKMMEQTAQNVSSVYIDFMTAIAQYMINSGQNVYLLNHEGDKDEKILHSINERLANPLPILTNLTGLDIKSIIKNAKLVISGRYHGVVSGLTQGVPTLCTGWSHKYAELLKEHKCDDNFLEVDKINVSISKVKDALTNPKAYISKVGCEEEIEKKANEMWKRIFS